MADVAEVDDEAQAPPALVELQSRRIVLASRRDLEAHDVVAAQRVALVDLQTGRRRRGRKLLGEGVGQRHRLRVDEDPVLHPGQLAAQLRRL